MQNYITLDTRIDFELSEYWKVSMTRLHQAKKKTEKRLNENACKLNKYSLTFSLVIKSIVGKLITPATIHTNFTNYEKIFIECDTKRKVYAFQRSIIAIN